MSEEYSGLEYPTLYDILEVMEEKNYRIFSNEAKGYNLNLADPSSVGTWDPE